MADDLTAVMRERFPELFNEDGTLISDWSDPLSDASSFKDYLEHQMIFTEIQYVNGGGYGPAAIVTANVLDPKSRKLTEMQFRCSAESAIAKQVENGLDQHHGRPFAARVTQARSGNKQTYFTLAAD